MRIGGAELCTLLRISPAALTALVQRDLAVRLDLSGADLSRLIGGPVLDGHRSETTRDQLGVIEAAAIRPEGLWVRLKFRSNEAAQAVMADIADSTLRGLSTGYTVQKWADSREGAQRIKTATRWQALEVSIVPIPADATAQLRNGESSTETETIETATTTAENTRAETNREIRSVNERSKLTRLQHLILTHLSDGKAARRAALI